MLQFAYHCGRRPKGDGFDAPMPFSNEEEEEEIEIEDSTDDEKEVIEKVDNTSLDDDILEVLVEPSNEGEDKNEKDDEEII